MIAQSMILLLSLASAVIGAEVDLCKVCSGSCSDYQPQINCQETGKVKQLPSKVRPDTVKIIFLGEHFSNPIIRPENFTNYPPKLQQLKMLNCGITEIMPNAFSQFAELRSLDLSNNEIQYIGDDAFAKVQIGHLMLNENANIQFAANAFRNAQIEKISIKQSNLHAIHYETFRPLFAKLKLLDLAANRITQLDKRFAGHLTRVERINLENNPFNCACSLKWLANLFASRQQNSPTCAEPVETRGRLMGTLVESDFYCDEPKIEKIDIDLQQESRESLLASLRCEARGSAKMSTRWFREGSDFRNTPAGQQFGWYSLVNVAQDLQTTERLMCVAEDINGNTTTRLTLKWPERVQTAKEMTASTQFPPRPELEFEDHQLGFFLTQQFTMMEMAGAIVGTFTVTLALFLLCCCAKDPYRRFPCCYSTSSEKSARRSPGMKYTKASEAPYTTEHLLAMQTPNTMQKQISPFSYTANRIFVPSSGDESTNLQPTSSGERNSLSSPGAAESLRKRVASMQQLHNPTYEHIPGMNSFFSDCQTYEAPGGYGQNPAAASLLAHHLNTLAVSQIPLPPLPTENPPPPDASVLYQAQLAALAAGTMGRGPPVGGFDLAMFQQQLQIAQMIQMNQQQQQQSGSNESGSS